MLLPVEIFGAAALRRLAPLSEQKNAQSDVAPLPHGFIGRVSAASNGSRSLFPGRVVMQRMVTLQLPQRPGSVGGQVHRVGNIVDFESATGTAIHRHAILALEPCLEGLRQVMGFA